MLANERSIKIDDLMINLTIDSVTAADYNLVDIVSLYTILLPYNSGESYGSSVEARDLFARSAYKIIPRPKTTSPDVTGQGVFIGRSSLDHVKATTQHMTLSNRHGKVSLFRPYSSKIWHFWGDANRTAIADAYRAYRKWLTTYRAKILESESKKEDRHQQKGFDIVRSYTNAVYSGRSPETLRWLTKSIDAQRIASQTPRIFIPNGIPGSEGKLEQLPLSEVDEGSVD